MVAKVDTRRVDLVSDKTTIINSGNDSGVFRKHYRWYGMNKNVVYDDDQIGDEQNTSAFSVTDKRGAGNFIILDIMRVHASGTGSDLLRFDAETTYYWHENRVIDLNENTIVLHPLHVLVTHIGAWISIGQPNAWFAPLDQFRFSVKTFHRDPCLRTQPLLERRKNFIPPRISSKTA